MVGVGVELGACYRIEINAIITIDSIYFMCERETVYGTCSWMNSWSKMLMACSGNTTDI